MTAKTIPAATSSASEPFPSAASRRWPRSGVVGFVTLTAIYFCLSLTASPDAYLSTDVGGKTAALAAMIERGDWSPDLGYWAEASDPDGVAYPFAHTTLTETGWWVNTTSLPMVLAARPLWVAGGAQLALLIPMMAAAGAAVVAGQIQARLDSRGGRSAMWVVGLTTPAVVYALDFWEHSLGLWLMALGTLLVLDSIESTSDDDRTRPWLASPAAKALGAGLAFGFGATMRQEAMIYGFVAGVLLTVELLRGASRRSWTGFGRALLPSAAMAGGGVLMLAMNAIIEAQLYGSAFRSSRSVDAAVVAGDEVGERIDAAFTTTLSPLNGVDPIATFFGLAVLGGLVWLVLGIRTGSEVRLPAVFLVATAAILAVRVIRLGPSFVPGMVPTAPLVVIGAGLGWATRKQRLMLVMALGPLPLVYLTQYTAGAVPQWGGRYMLLSGLLLVVLACVELPRRHGEAFRGLVVAGLLVTACGVWFNAVRTNSLERDFEMIEDVADGAVVVWYDSVKAREAGPEIIEHRWLSTAGDAERSTVLRILEEGSIDRFVYVDPVDDEQVSFDGFEAVSAVGQWELGPILRQRLTVFQRTG